MRNIILGIVGLSVVALVLPATAISASAEEKVVIKKGREHHDHWWHRHHHDKKVIIKHRDHDND